MIKFLAMFHCLMLLFRVALKFRDNPVLLTKVTQIRKVLELMSDREFKNRYDVNEVRR